MEGVQLSSSTDGKIEAKQATLPRVFAPLRPAVAPLSPAGVAEGRINPSDHAGIGTSALVESLDGSYVPLSSLEGGPGHGCSPTALGRRPSSSEASALPPPAGRGLDRTILSASQQTHEGHDHRDPGVRVCLLGGADRTSRTAQRVSRGRALSPAELRARPDADATNVPATRAGAGDVSEHWGLTASPAPSARHEASPEGGNEDLGVSLGPFDALPPCHVYMGHNPEDEAVADAGCHRGSGASGTPPRHRVPLSNEKERRRFGLHSLPVHQGTSPNMESPSAWESGWQRELCSWPNRPDATRPFPSGDTNLARDRPTGAEPSFGTSNSPRGKGVEPDRGTLSPNGKGRSGGHGVSSSHTVRVGRGTDDQGHRSCPEVAEGSSRFQCDERRAHGASASGALYKKIMEAEESFESADDLSERTMLAKRFGWSCYPSSTMPPTGGEAGQPWVKTRSQTSGPASENGEVMSA